MYPTIRDGTGQHFCSLARPELTKNHQLGPFMLNYNLFSGPNRPMACNMK